MQPTKFLQRTLDASTQDRIKSILLSDYTITWGLFGAFEGGGMGPESVSNFSMPLPFLEKVYVESRLNLWTPFFGQRMAKLKAWARDLYGGNDVQFHFTRDEEDGKAGKT